VLEGGGSVPSQTRTYDVASGRTVLLRSKETALDYRFMPEPDLPPLVIPQAVLDELKRTTPELPAATATRFGLLLSHIPHTPPPRPPPLHWADSDSVSVNPHKRGASRPASWSWSSGRGRVESPDCGGVF
jgi:hypothetical protein